LIFQLPIDGGSKANQRDQLISIMLLRPKLGIKSGRCPNTLQHPAELGLARRRYQER